VPAVETHQQWPAEGGGGGDGGEHTSLLFAVGERGKKEAAGLYS